MKKFWMIVVLLFLVGCENKDRLECTLSIRKKDFKDNWKFSFIFKEGKLESFSNTSFNFYSPYYLEIPVEIENAQNLKIGDVVAFREKNSEGITIHRIIDIVEKDGISYFITKGDENSTQDRDLLSLEDVLFQSVGSISDLDKKSYDYVKKYFEQKGYSCK